MTDPIDKPAAAERGTPERLAYASPPALMTSVVLSIVLLSGSNDVFFPEGFAHQVERLMAIAGPQRRVVWVAPYVVRPRYAPADEHNSRGLRADLLAAAQHHRNLHVVDWSGHVLALDDAARRARMPDGAHPSALGCEELSRLIAAVVTARSR